MIAWKDISDHVKRLDMQGRLYLIRISQGQIPICSTKFYMCPTPLQEESVLWFQISYQGFHSCILSDGFLVVTRV